MPLTGTTLNMVVLTLSQLQGHLWKVADILWGAILECLPSGAIAVEKQAKRWTDFPL
jgi:hypothetical protein